MQTTPYAEYQEELRWWYLPLLVTLLLLSMCVYLPILVVDWVAKSVFRKPKT